jgi:DNA-binding ferritin-like protein
MDEIDDELIKQQRHEEITRALEVIAKAIQDNNKLDPLALILKDHSQKAEQLISAIREISTVKDNEIDKGVVSLLKENADNLNKTLIQLNTAKPKEWVFDISRDSFGKINSITATSKIK